MTNSRKQILLLLVVEIAEFYSRTHGDFSFVHQIEELWSKLGEADVAEYLPSAITLVFR